MKNNWSILGKFFAGVIAVSLVLTSVRAAAGASSPDRVVVMISVDGLAAYYIDDPKADMPNLRHLAAEGARASMMKASTPTVTWPNHTTLVTGDNPARHGVVGNNYFDRKTGQKVTLISDPVFDKDQIVKVPTIYDVAKAAGMKTAAIRWPATRNAKTLDWTIPDMRTADLVKQYSTPGLLDECKNAGIDVLGDSESNESPDDKWTAMFDYILREHRPRLALLHVAFVDHTEHLHGPKSPEAYAAVHAADHQIGEVWKELKKDFPNHATLIVVSDHGFSPIKKSIFPNVALRKAGLYQRKGGEVNMVSQGGAAMLYIRDEAKRDEVMAKIREALAGVEGISKIAGPKELKQYGVADPAVDPHAPDMILFADEGCTFGDTAAGSLPFNDKPERKGSHGHDSNLPDLHATFVMWGVGVKTGVKTGEISNIDVAPTIAKFLNLQLPNPDGKPLTEMMSN
uniref:Type I phosphodiesterase / nucleotide pyrophosphatase n=1 Tax=uncultured organism TaxID=155900 RepID=A0A3G1QTF7_9ZZZZ|nr:hypothetical protein [uncultured organism]